MDEYTQPAFPMPASDLPGSFVTNEGMSLRDYFAAAALANTVYVDSECDAETAAEFAYDIADAMMEVRKQ